jgi:imidazole glycerol-phosphate synthase subunit HisF
MTDVVVVDSGVANLASIRVAFDRLGQPTRLATRPEDLEGASHIVLPGVGAFSAIERLRNAGLDAAIRDAISQNRAVLAICLGMQMLCEGSDEAPAARGIGVIPGRCVALPDSVRVPHLGWNWVAAATDCRYLTSGSGAYANSFALPAQPDGWSVAWTTHGARFVAAAERGAVVACQFHPELSGAFGVDLLGRWLMHGPRPVDRAHDDRRTIEPGAPLNVGHRSGVVARIVPCLDVCDGRVVKGTRFTSLRDTGDPAERAERYEAQGADEIVLLDIGASPSVREHQTETVVRVRQRLRIPLTVGGGVRNVADARRLLEAGADKVSVNTAAVRDPLLLARLAQAFGSQCVVLAIDARRHGDAWRVLITGGREDTGLDVSQWAERGVAQGAGEILLTSWDRDGTRAGCDLELLRHVADCVRVPLIASGGVGKREDALDAFRAGAHAVLAASIFHDGDETVSALKSYLHDHGVMVRS